MLGAQCHFNSVNFGSVKRAKIIYRMFWSRLGNDVFKKRKKEYYANLDEKNFADDKPLKNC